MVMASEQVQQQLLTQAQVYQQQMQGIAIQKETLNVQSLEISTALDELEKAKGDVYKLTGPLLIKSPKGEVKKDLEEKKELIGIKIKTLDKSEGKIKSKMEELREELMKLGAGK